MFSFNFLIFWTLINTIHRQFFPMSYCLCISYPNLTLQTHKGLVALQGAHSGSRCSKCASRELTRKPTTYYRTEQYGLSFCITSPCAASFFYMSVSQRRPGLQTYRSHTQLQQKWREMDTCPAPETKLTHKQTLPVLR